MGKTIKIFAIGNSFSDNSMNYLGVILKAFGVEKFILGNMYIGGCSIETHLKNSKSMDKNYIYRKLDSEVNSDMKFVSKNDVSLTEGILDEAWDIITLQEASPISGLIKEEDGKNIDELLDYVKINNKNARIGWNMTWAYQGDSKHPGFINYNNSQSIMYNSIVDSVKKIIKNNKRIDFVIPSGTSIQNARTSYLGDKLTSDGHHLCSLGEFIVGVTWVLSIFGFKIEDLKIDLVEEIFKKDMDVIKEAVSNAVNDPFIITESRYNIK